MVQSQRLGVLKQLNVTNTVWCIDPETRTQVLQQLSSLSATVP